MNPSQVYEKELSFQADRRRASVKFISIVNDLWFDKSIELVLFKNSLINKNVGEVLKLHEYAGRFVDKPISIFDSTEVAEGIKNLNLKYDIDHFISKKINLDYGLHSTWYEFNPGEIAPNSDSSGISPSELTKKYAFENALYLAAEQNLTDNIQLEYGLRLSSFFRLGQNGFASYENDEPVAYNSAIGIYDEAPIISRENISRSSTIESFHNLEPRFSVAYSLNDNQSIKLVRSN